MKLNDVNITETIEQAKALLQEEKNISPALKTVFELLLMVIQLMMQRSDLTVKILANHPQVILIVKRPHPKRIQLTVNPEDNLVVKAHNSVQFLILIKSNLLKLTSVSFLSKLILVMDMKLGKS